VTERVLEELPSGQLTDEEFLVLRGRNYLRMVTALAAPQPGLLEFMGMTAGEYAAWLTEGLVPERVMRVAGRRG
jgi:hypothetical protein